VGHDREKKTMRVIYSEKASHELLGIQDYLGGSFSPRIANEKIDKIRRDIEILAGNPFFGREITNGIRKTVSGMSVILYEVVGDNIEIHHIVDCRTDWVNTLFS